MCREREKKRRENNEKNLGRGGEIGGCFLCMKLGGKI